MYTSPTNGFHAVTCPRCLATCPVPAQIENLPQPFLPVKLQENLDRMAGVLTPLHTDRMAGVLTPLHTDRMAGVLTPLHTDRMAGVLTPLHTDRMAGVLTPLHTDRMAGVLTPLPTDRMAGVHTPLHTDRMAGVHTPLPTDRMAGVHTPLHTDRMAGVLTPLPTDRMAGVLTPLPTDRMAGVLTPLHTDRMAGVLTPLHTDRMAGVLTPLHTDRMAGVLTPLPTDRMAGVLTPLHTDRMAGVLTPLPTDRMAGVLTPLHTDRMAGVLTPLHTDRMAGVLTPLHTDRMAGVLTPLHTDRMAGVLTPLHTQANCETTTTQTIETARTDKDHPVSMVTTYYPDQAGDTNCGVIHYTETLDSTEVVRRWTHTFTLPMAPAVEHIAALTFQPDGFQLAVKCDDVIGGPMKVYDLKGRRTAEFGCGIAGLDGGGRVAMDTHRGVYIAACYGILYTLTTEGCLREAIPIKGSNLQGVTYIKEHDLYVVSDVTDHKITLIDPRSKVIVRSFGSRGKGPKEFNRPYHISTCSNHGNPSIIVSDCLNNRVRICDVTGSVTSSYGSSGAGYAQLSSPCGVHMDTGGELMVCDFDNSRVVSFQNEFDVYKFECVFGEEEVRGKPYCLAADPSENTMVVNVGNVILFYSKQ